MLFDTRLTPSFFAPLPTLHALQGQLERILGEDRSRSASPGFALYEREDALLLRALLPGVEAKDLDIEVEGDMLALSGRFENDPAEERAVATHRERPRGAFRRVLRLPFEVDASGVEARLERGVLEVRIPRLQRTPPVKIQVRTETTKN